MSKIICERLHDPTGCRPPVRLGPPSRRGVPLRRWGTATGLLLITAMPACNVRPRQLAPMASAVRSDAALDVIRAADAFQGGMTVSAVGQARQRLNFSERRLLHSITWIRQECAGSSVYYQLASLTAPNVRVPAGLTSDPPLARPLNLPVWVVTCPDFALQTMAGQQVVPTTWLFDADDGASLGEMSFRAPRGDQ